MAFFTLKTGDKFAWNLQAGPSIAPISSNKKHLPAKKREVLTRQTRILKEILALSKQTHCNSCLRALFF